jgi:hypothetical protein
MYYFFTGKMETRTQKQCKDYIRPLFRMCKKKEVPFSILDKLVLMVKHCEEGNFLAANDQYIRTAIGNAAWPIGELVQYIDVVAVGTVVDNIHVMCVVLSSKLTNQYTVLLLLLLLLLTVTRPLTVDTPFPYLDYYYFY